MGAQSRPLLLARSAKARYNETISSHKKGDFSMLYTIENEFFRAVLNDSGTDAANGQG